MRSLLLLALLLSGCGWMWDQPKVKAFRESPLPLAFPEDRVALGENLDQAVRLGLKPEGGFAENPYAFTEADLLRGKALYQSFCAICHGVRGEGDGRAIPLGVP